ncbi:metallothionein-3-like [Condylostylus longicornis]|nr:metallothionein-3-like [Condylostylus longicornis]
MGCVRCEHQCNCTDTKCGTGCGCVKSCKCTCKNGPKEDCCKKN